MIRHTITRVMLALAAGIALITGCSQNDDVNDADIEFAQGMIPHHAQALDMSQLVPERSSNSDVIELAAQIEAAQDPEIELMSGWLTEWGEDVPDTTDDGHAGHGPATGMMTDEQMAAMESAVDDEFDRMFLEMMIEHHEGAIVMAEDVLDSGTNIDVKDLAQEIIDTQQAEIDYMRELLREA